MSTITTSEDLINGEGEVVVSLPNGWSIRSGGSELVSGEYVRIVRPDESEYAYWDAQEWADDPASVMGAIINAAAGFRPLDD